MKTLFFIDTNIFLDFYRLRNDLSISVVKEIEKIVPSLICTYQVEMEFKKNRQRVILDGLSTLKAPSTIPRLGILSDDRSHAALVKDLKKAEARVKLLHTRLGRILEDPVRNDPIYKVLQRIFKKGRQLMLYRGTPPARQIRRLALKRFLLGYPPRKNNDISTGDAVNWEWIIDCAVKAKANVVLVSRDSDYGVSKEKKSHINDWLREEFKERVGKKANITLTQFLSVALKELQVHVPPGFEKKEECLAKASPCRRDTEVLGSVFRSRTAEMCASEGFVDEAIANSILDLIDCDEVCTVIATKNAVAWSVDDHEVNEIYYDADHTIVHLSFTASGEQLEDRPLAGTSIAGKATAHIYKDGRVEYSNVQIQEDTLC